MGPDEQEGALHEVEEQQSEVYRQPEDAAEAAQHPQEGMISVQMNQGKEDQPDSMYQADQQGQPQQISEPLQADRSQAPLDVYLELEQLRAAHATCVADLEQAQSENASLYAEKASLEWFRSNSQGKDEDFVKSLEQRHVERLMEITKQQQLALESKNEEIGRLTTDCETLAMQLQEGRAATNSLKKQAQQARSHADEAQSARQQLDEARREAERLEGELQMQRETSSARAMEYEQKIQELEESQAEQKRALQATEEEASKLRTQYAEKDELVMELQSLSLQGQDEQGQRLQQALRQAAVLQARVDELNLELSDTRDRARLSKKEYQERVQLLQEQRKGAHFAIKEHKDRARDAVKELTNFKSQARREDGTRMAQLQAENSRARSRILKLEQEQRELSLQLAEQTARAQKLAEDNDRLTRLTKEAAYKDRHAADLLEHHEEVNAKLKSEGEEQQRTLAALSDDLLQARRQLEQHKELPHKVAELELVVAQREGLLAARILSLDKEINAAKALAGSAVQKQARQAQALQAAEQTAEAERGDLLVLLAHSERRADALQGQLDHYLGKEAAMKRKEQDMAAQSAATEEANKLAQTALAKARRDQAEAEDLLGSARSQSEALYASLSAAARNEMSEAQGGVVPAPVDMPEDHGSQARVEYETARAALLSELGEQRDAGAVKLRAMDKGERARIAELRRAVRQAEADALADAQARRLAAQAERARWRRPALLQAAAQACVGELLPWFGFGVVQGKQGDAIAAGAVDGGLLVSTVSENGPADAAGLCVGDWLVQADGAAMRDQQALTALFAQVSAGQVLSLVVVRGGEEVAVSLTVGSREACVADLEVVRRALSGQGLEDTDYDLPLLQPYIRALVPEDFPAGHVQPTGDKQGAGALAEDEEKKKADEEEEEEEGEKADLDPDTLAAVKLGARARLQQFVPHFGIAFANRGSDEAAGAAKPGAVVTRVEPQGPAALAGVQPDDVVEAVDGAPIATSWAFEEVFAKAMVGDTIVLHVRRGKEQQDLVLVAGSLRAPPRLVRTLRRLADGRITKQDVDTGVVAFFSRQQQAAVSKAGGQHQHKEQTQTQQQPVQRYDEEELVAAATAALTGAKPWLGWSLRARRHADNHSDIVVVAVDPESPAAQAGVRAGDHVHALGNQAVVTAQAARTLLSSAHPGSLFPIVLQRGDEDPRVLKVAVGVQAWPAGAAEWCRRVAGGKVLQHDHQEAARLHAAGVLRLQRLPKQPPTMRPELQALAPQSLGLPGPLFFSEEEEKRLALERARQPVPDATPAVTKAAEAMAFAEQSGVLDEPAKAATAAAAPKAAAAASSPVGENEGSGEDYSSNKDHGSNSLAELDGEMLLPTTSALSAGDAVEVPMEL